jgi:hypothetical protein
VTFRVLGLRFVAQVGRWEPNNLATALITTLQCSTTALRVMPRTRRRVARLTFDIFPAAVMRRDAVAKVGPLVMNVERHLRLSAAVDG